MNKLNPKIVSLIKEGFKYETLKSLNNQQINALFKRIVSEVSTAQDIYLIGTEILTHAYIDLKCHDLYDVIKQCNMKTISEIATDWQLPLQFTSDTVVTRMEILEDIKTIQADDGTKFFITVDYEEIVLDKVKKLLQDAKEPVKVCAQSSLYLSFFIAVNN